MNMGALHYPWHVVGVSLSRFSQIGMHVPATLLNSANNVAAVQTLLTGICHPKELFHDFFFFQMVLLVLGGNCPFCYSFVCQSV